MLTKIERKTEILPYLFLLAIAYSASLGGIATLIGTPTNIMLASILSDNYKFNISFFDWLKIGLPITIILLPLVWFILTRVVFTVSKSKSNALELTIKKLKEEIGKPTCAERIVGIVFFFTAILVDT